MYGGVLLILYLIVFIIQIIILRFKDNIFKSNKKE